MPDLITVFSPAANREFRQVPWPNESGQKEPWTTAERLAFANNWWVAAYAFVRARDAGDSARKKELRPAVVLQRYSKRFREGVKDIVDQAEEEKLARIMLSPDGPAPSGRSVLSLRAGA